jgi:hypothetical protein
MWPAQANPPAVLSDLQLAQITLGEALDQSRQRVGGKARDGLAVLF